MVFDTGLAVVLLLGSSGLVTAQGVQINLDGIQTNGSESQVATDKIEFFPPCVRNRITNNTPSGYTLSWPGAGPGGFSSRLFPGPDVGTQWVWDTSGSVFNLQSSITFERGLGLPVPTAVNVWLTDESGDFLPQPGELLTLDFEILNVGTDPLSNPIAELRSPPDFFNPLAATFIQPDSLYPQFPGLSDADLGQCDPPTEPVIFPQTNLTAFMVRLPPNQVAGATRIFQLVFQGTVPGQGAVTTVLPVPLGIGRVCNPLASDGRPYDGLSGLLAPVDADLVPKGYPVNVSSGTFPVGPPIPLRLALRCGAHPNDPARLDPPPQIRSITQAGVELPLTGIHAGPGDPDDPAFICNATECSFGLDTAQIPEGETVIEVKLPDGRSFRAGLTISGP